MKKDVQVKAFFCTEHTCATDVTDQQVERRAAFARIRPEDQGRRRSSPRRRRSRSCSERSPELVKDLTYNPLPDAFEVQPNRAEDVEAIAADLRAQKFAGVEKVDYGERPPGGSSASGR